VIPDRETDNQQLRELEALLGKTERKLP